MDTNLSAGYRNRLHNALGVRAPGAGPKSQLLEKSLSQPQMEGAIREGTHPEGFDDKMALAFLGGNVGDRVILQRELGQLAFRVSAVNMNRMAKGVDGWKLEKLFAGRYNHREATPVYMEVEVAPGVKEEVLISGSRVFRGPDGAVSIVGVRPTPYGSFEMSVLSTKASGAGQGFLKALDEMDIEKNFFAGQKITAEGHFLKLSEIVEEDLILPPGMLKEIKRNVVDRIERAAAYKTFGLPTKRGLILAGDPGVGKTMALKLMAKSLPATFILTTPTMIPRAHNVAALFEFARSVSPAVIALEDSEVICKYDWQGRDPRLVELLSQLDGVVENAGVTTILTTNYPSQLDKAIRDRPGRFDVRLDVPLPGMAEIAGIIRRNIARSGNTTYGGDDESLQDVAQRMANAGVSGAYAKEAVTYASILAIERGRGDGETLVVAAADLGDAARNIIEYKKRMAGDPVIG